MGHFDFDAVPKVDRSVRIPTVEYAERVSKLRKRRVS